jgi:hypothetical protein
MGISSIADFPADFPLAHKVFTGPPVFGEGHGKYVEPGEVGGQKKGEGPVNLEFHEVFIFTQEGIAIGAL